MAKAAKESAQIEVVKDYGGRGVLRILKGSSRYYMRFRFRHQRGWTPWRKTGTSDLSKASQIASDEYQRIRERLAGATEQQDLAKVYDDFTFIGAATRWLSMYRRKAEMEQPAKGSGRPASLAQYESYKDLVDRFMGAFFGRKNLDRIETDDIYDYIEWRRAYYTVGPGSKVDTIEVERNGKTYRHKIKHKAVELRSGELAVIKAIFEFASKEGLITAKQIPEIPRSSKAVREIEKSRHPAFSKEHWKIIEDKIDTYTKARSETEQKARIAFKYYMLIMAECGLRPGKEQEAIRWRHVEFDNVEKTGESVAYIHVPEDTKTGTRLIVVGPYGTKLIKDFKAWTAFSGDEDPFFADQKTGKAIKRYTTQFRNFLKFCDIEKSKDDKAYAPYSLRHTYATRMRERGLPDHIIARLMGHVDTAMISKHYGQDAITSHAERIAATDEARMPKKVAGPIELEKALLVSAVLSFPKTGSSELVLEKDDGTSPKLVLENGMLTTKRPED